MPFDMQIAPSTFDPEMRTVDAVVATASPVRRRDAKGTFMEVLDVATLDLDAMRGVPVLDNHRSASVCDAIGRVVSFRREDDQLVATLRLSAAPDVSGVLARIADGTLTGVSIGYVVATWREASIAGQRTRTAVRWTITEVTLTTNPADPAARLRHTEKENLMEPDDQTIDTPPRPKPSSRRAVRRSAPWFGTPAWLPSWPTT